MTTTHEALTKEELHLHAGIGDDDKALIENLRHYRDVSQGEALRRTLTQAAGRLERLAATIGAVAQRGVIVEAADRIRELEAENDRLRQIVGLGEDQVTALERRIRELEAALRGLLTAHVELVNSGDCGNWDPEVEVEVIAARAALDTQTGRVDPAPLSDTAPTATVNRR
jgi:predicted nuclease with TOPRIM domain